MVRRMSPHRAPGGAAGLVRPGVAGVLITVPAPGAPLRPLGGSGRGGGAALHADAVVAVAGDRVDPAELVGVLVDTVLAISGEQVDDRAACRDSSLVGARGRDAPVDDVARPTVSRRSVLPLRNAGASAGAAQSRSSSSSSQNRVSERPAMSKLVTDLADLGFDDLDPGVGEQLRDPAVDHEQFFVLDRAEAVEDGHDPRARPRRMSRAARPAAGRRGSAASSSAVGMSGLADAGFAVDAEADGDPAVGHLNSGAAAPGQRAAGEGDAHRAGAEVGRSRPRPPASRSYPAAAAAAATLKTTRSPAMPRRLCRSSTGAL